MNMQDLNVIDHQHLSLAESPKPRDDKASPYPKFQQDIENFGDRLIIKTPPVKFHELRYVMNEIGYSVIVPICDTVRADLDVVEYFVKENTCIPSELLNLWPVKRLSFYKPLFRGSAMCIKLGKYCTFYNCNLRQNCSVNDLPQFGAGQYSFSIEIPNVYYGPHRDDYLCSLNMRIVRIDYSPLPWTVTHEVVEQPQIKREANDIPPDVVPPKKSRAMRKK